jgi:hypothetical protein
MGKILEHFDNEIKIIKEQNENEDLIIEHFIKPIREIIEIFEKQEHSGFSASIYSGAIVNTIKRVLNFEAIAPITGDDEEWVKIGNNTFQNKRQGNIFKETSNNETKAYFLDGIIWSGEDEYDTFTGTVQGIPSKINITFPVTTKTFYVDVVRRPGICTTNDSWIEDENENRYHYEIKDISQLREVEEYYKITLLN